MKVFFGRLIACITTLLSSCISYAKCPYNKQQLPHTNAKYKVNSKRLTASFVDKFIETRTIWFSRCFKSVDAHRHRHRRRRQPNFKHHNFSGIIKFRFISLHFFFSITVACANIVGERTVCRETPFLAPVINNQTAY